jgi:hypothetical protein
LHSDGKTRGEDIDRLVDSTETLLSTEHTGWVQMMQHAMAKIHEQKPTVSSTSS